MSDEPDAEPQGRDHSRSDRRSAEPLVLLLIGLVVAGVLFAASALPVILSRDADELATGATVTTAAVASEATEPAPTTVADETATTESTSTSVAPTTTEPAPTGDVAESVAVVSSGQIVLEGAVPDEASRAEILELAIGIFGPENVVDNYVIDERATDPSLGNVRIEDPVLFVADSAELSPESEPLLTQGLALLTVRPEATFTVIGYTDSLGGETYNLELSQARANAMVRWWVDRGIDPTRLTAIGRGEADPIASNDTKEGRTLNRRIEVRIENLLVNS